MPLGTAKAALLGAGAGGNANYFGDGSDGALTTSGNVTYTVANKVGSYDGDMYVANYTSMNVSAGHTLATDQQARGLIIYCQGNCVLNGDINQSGKGGDCDPTASGGSDSSAVSTTGLRLPMFTASGTDTLAAADFAGAGNAAVAAVANQPGIAGDGTIFTASKLGGTGGSGGSGSSGNGGGSGSGGSAGTTGGATLSTGGGGGGGWWSTGSTVTGGSGGQGGCFSGGAGGGGQIFSGTGSGGGNYGGGGGSGGGGGNQGGAHGGSGNPGGGANGNGPSYGGNPQPGGTGCGGLVYLIVGGDLTFGASSNIVSRGVNGNTGGHRTSQGGGSGGGTVFVLYAGTLTDGGVTISADGGNNGGGNGGVYTAQVLAA
tara:strand:- start:1270 stop:2388 length:1119 start_codon:yes stop_codon:yes gene_type:complete